MDPTPEPEVLFRREGHMGRITLNRPWALNALTERMVHAIAAQLETWEQEVGLVLIDAAGPKAFCAGGDVVALHRAGEARDYTAAGRFWASEYRLNDRIAHYARPVVVLIHGFCMGGGVGLACHASHRIVGESVLIALPECALGLVPDVGSTRLLARAPAGIGPWMALTGARLGPGAALVAGFADSFVPEADWDALRSRLTQTGDALDLAAFLRPAPLANLPDAATLAAFTQPDLPQILHALQGTAPEALAQIAKGSPLALSVALEMQQLLGPQPSLRAALALEYRAVQRALKQGDFLEGTRARIIARDNDPRWRHARPEAVTRPEIAAHLAPLEGDDLEFPALEQEITA